MTTIINVPPSLDDKSFEQVFDQLARFPLDAKVLVDARRTRVVVTLRADRPSHACADAARETDARDSGE